MKKQQGDMITIELGGKTIRAQVKEVHSNGTYDVTVTGGREPQPIFGVSEGFILEDENWEPSKVLQDACKPLMMYLAVNHHPHTIAIISSTSIEIYSGEKTILDVHDHLPN